MSDHAAEPLPAADLAGLDRAGTERRLYYSASWQLTHEEVADDYQTSAAADYWVQEFLDIERNLVEWGKRNLPGRLPGDKRFVRAQLLPLISAFGQRSKNQRW